jgi:hypothetical protein
MTLLASATCIGRRRWPRPTTHHETPEIMITAQTSPAPAADAQTPTPVAAGQIVLPRAYGYVFILTAVLVVASTTMLAVSLMRPVHGAPGPTCPGVVIEQPPLGPWFIAPQGHNSTGQLAV